MRPKAFRTAKPWRTAKSELEHRGWLLGCEDSLDLAETVVRQNPLDRHRRDTHRHGAGGMRQSAPGF